MMEKEDDPASFWGPGSNFSGAFAVKLQVGNKALLRDY